MKETKRQQAQEHFFSLFPGKPASSKLTNLTVQITAEPIESQLKNYFSLKGSNKMTNQ